MSDDEKNLGAMFAKSGGRGRGAIAERVKSAAVARDDVPLTPVPTPVVPVTDAEPSDEDAPATPDLEPAQKAAAGSKKKASAKKAARPASSGASDYSLYVPIQILPEFRKRRAEEGTQNALLVFDAIEELVERDAKDPYERLRGFVQASLVGGAKKPAQASLFERKPTRAQNSPYAGPTAPIVLRLTPTNRDVFDDLVEKTGAKDPGHLASVALVHYLGLAEA
ncbi:hypothetical protein [Promicromonospora sp. NFX87]|uniref:hypothetical protein n=1 Tax=Promicromonospora sp. NFX87 TaxID=3402691 RepID=UPI003AFA7384